MVSSVDGTKRFVSKESLPWTCAAITSLSVLALSVLSLGPKDVRVCAFSAGILRRLTRSDRVALALLSGTLSTVFAAVASQKGKAGSQGETPALSAPDPSDLKTVLSEARDVPERWRSLRVSLRKIVQGGSSQTKVIGRSHWCEMTRPDQKGNHYIYWPSVRPWRDRSRSSLSLIDWMGQDRKNQKLRPLKILTDEEREQCRILCKKGLWTTSGGDQVELSHALVTVDAHGRMYAHPEDSLDFKHTSLSGGRPVRYAGVLRIETGRLIAIANASGHYLPGDIETYDFLRQLKRLEMPLGEVRVVDRGNDQLEGDLTCYPTGEDELTRLHGLVGGVWLMRRLPGWFKGKTIPPLKGDRYYALTRKRSIGEAYTLHYKTGERVSTRTLCRRVSSDFKDEWYWKRHPKETVSHPQILIDELLEGKGYTAWHTLPESSRNSLRKSAPSR